MNQDNWPFALAFMALGMCITLFLLFVGNLQSGVCHL